MPEIWECVGNTPIVDVDGISFKLEYLNPGGSHKDRMAVSMLLDLIDRKGRGGAIVEATSGCTGVSLSLHGRAMGFDVYITVKEDSSPVKVALMRSLGAKVYTCPNVPPEDPRSIKSVAKRIAEEKGATFLMQDSNPANPRGQERMGEEILESLRRVDVFVMGVGTGGTITGVGKLLKKEFGTKIIAVTSKGSELARKFGLSSKFEGEVEGYDSYHIPDNLDLSLVDEVYEVSRAEAIEWASELLKKGIMGGMSTGAHYLASLYAKKKYGGTVVTVAADSVLFHPPILNASSGVAAYKLPF
ncbi:MAG: pyridoxal-phosphate dependent enzyme [Candidatus Korarchaeum sp.]|nr:pyridoxal-phosphate dependent enzyme [Candidatus Korarchaeum sp.]